MEQPNVGAFIDTSHLPSVWPRPPRWLFDRPITGQIVLVRLQVEDEYCFLGRAFRRLGPMPMMRTSSVYGGHPGFFWGAERSSGTFVKAVRRIVKHVRHLIQLGTIYGKRHGNCALRTQTGHVAPSQS